VTLEDSLKLWSKFEGQTTKDQAVELYNSVISSPKGDVIEVGSACGGTTIILIGAAEEVEKMVYSIDPYPQEFEGHVRDYTIGIMSEFKEKFRKNILTGQWSNIIQYNESLSKCIDRIPSFLSVVFIDGCHEFSFVFDELIFLTPRLVDRGSIFMHDFNWNEGQISKTEGTGVSTINKIFLDIFIDVKVIDSMVCGKKGMKH
jgi:hypothetical protein